MTAPREGSLDAPTRHAIDWRNPEFGNEAALDTELERIFDICHGCRRCFSLCHAFPNLFDAIDESDTGELDSVPKAAYWGVVDHCYLCDLCYMTKCPYVPPHEWNVDFPHLMLRAKVKRFKDGKASLRDKFLSATDTVGKLAGIPIVAPVINALNASRIGRSLLQAVLGIASDAPLPKYHRRSARGRLKHKIASQPPQAASAASSGVAIFATCYGNRNHPGLVEDLLAVFEHNAIETTLLASENCCGMPKLELGDLEAIHALKERNIDELHRWAVAGWKLTAVIPSCVLMFKQELPLLYPEDDLVKAVAAAFVDPFEYLLTLHRDGLLHTDFSESLGQIDYQVPCHLRVQNIGLKTRDVLELVPDTKVRPIERCSGHDGTYAVKREFRATSCKIARPVTRQVDATAAEHFCSDCPMAAEQIAALAESAQATHPIQLLRRAYGL